MYDHNNVHILIYVVFGLIGLIIGKFVAWLNIRLPEEKKIFTKEFFKQNKEGIEKSYINGIITAILYMFLLYKFGIGKTFMQNLDLIKYIVLIPMLISSFMIDLKYRILPNRLNMTIFEIGLLFTFIYGINNINIAQDMLLGMLTGAGIFGFITILGGLIAGKEAMGLGDVKFMGAVRTVFWSKYYCANIFISFFCRSYYFNFCYICKTCYFKKQR